MTIITYYCMSVKIESLDYILLEHIRVFLDKFYTLRQTSFGKSNKFDIKLFASKIKDKPIYIMHVNQFIHLYHNLKDIGYEIKANVKNDLRNYNSDFVDFDIRSHWVLRDYQEQIRTFLTTDPTKSKLVPIATGSGKTTIALHAIADLKQKLGIVILPTFIDKWISDITNVHEAITQDVMIIQGSKSLITLIDLAKTSGLNSKYYIFSSRTIQEYITTYENDPDLCVSMYGIEPLELFPLLGIGVMLVDETHMHFHSIFKTLIYTNVKYQIGLSATLISEEAVVRRIHKIVYPEKTVYKDAMLQKYTDIYAIAYSIPNEYMKHIKTSNYGSNTYSHLAFENSILSKDFLKSKYIKLIVSSINDYYISCYKPDDKLLIFVSTVEFATVLSNVLKDMFPKLIVNRYCENDPYDFLMKSDITVSTVISSGTAVDISNLRTVIQTVSISSPVSNIQTLGRLRKLPDRDTKYCYLYCTNIGKQKEYHMKKTDLYSDRSASISYRQSSVSF